MSTHTQRWDQIEAMAAAVVASYPPTGESIVECVRRLTGLDESECGELMGAIVGNTLVVNGITAVSANGDVHMVFQALVIHGMELGRRLGLEEAATLPQLDVVATPTRREPATYEGRRRGGLLGRFRR